MEPELHPALEALAGYLGTFSGRGRGSYPTIEPFEYEETVVFGHVGKPFLTYCQRTRDARDGRPLHSESGFWRVASPGQIELVIAHGSGVAEICEGTVGAGLISVRSTSVTVTSSATEVTALERRFTLAGDALRYELSMAAVGQPMTHHLSADLRREP